MLIQGEGLISLGWGGFIAAIGIAVLRLGADLFDKADNIEPVELITKHNTGHLPEIETLVRSSDRPTTDQQAELLRAARVEKQTPPEELLRATRVQKR